MAVKRHPVAVASQGDALVRVPLDTALVGRLRAAYETIRACELRFAEVFYAKLFTVAPQLRAMFPDDLRAQAAKLTASLDTIVRNFEDPGANWSVLSDLGRRHAGYGVKPEHYALVIDLLIESMHDAGGNAIDERSLQEWRSALRLISDQMIAAGGTR